MAVSEDAQHTRGHADREDAMVRAEGAGAHLWDHHDHLQERPRRPPSRQPEGFGCRPASTGLSPPIPGFLQEDVLESPLLGGVIEAGVVYDPAEAAASRSTLQPRTRDRGAPSAPFQP